MSGIRRGAASLVYLLHFDVPFKHARHYMGSTGDLEARLAEHASGRGARLLFWVHRAGIGWTLSRTWEGGRVRERQLKARGHGRHCPICTPPQRPARVDIGLAGAIATPARASSFARPRAGMEAER
jgi:predicted GIY-YIG superfamily endonuclease